MWRSIATESWQVNADDPLALTYVLAWPEFTGTGLEYAAHFDLLLVFCQPVYAVAVCPTCQTPSTQPHDRHERWVRDCRGPANPVPWSCRRAA